jgi:MFS family permease
MVGVVYALPSAAFIILAQQWTKFGVRRDFRKGITIGLTGTAVGLIFLPLANNIWIFSALYFFTGVWLAALSPSISGITCTRVDETFRGRAYAIQQSAGTLGGFISPLAAGGIAGACNNSIKPVFIFVAAIYITGIFVFKMLIKRWDDEPSAKIVQQAEYDQVQR